jgi:hypothetical protein
MSNLNNGFFDSMMQNHPMLTFFMACSATGVAGYSIGKNESKAEMAVMA